MKLILLLGGVIALSLAGVSPAEAKKIPRYMTVHQANAGTPDEGGWYEAESTRGRFYVTMPAPYNDFTVKIVDEDGKEGEIHIVGTKTPEDIKYYVFEYQKELKNIAQAIQQFVSYDLPDEYVHDEHRSFINGHPVFSYRVDWEQRHRASYRRIIQLPDRIILMVMEFVIGYEREADKSYDTFFESLDFPIDDEAKGIDYKDKPDQAQSLIPLE